MRKVFLMFLISFCFVSTAVRGSVSIKTFYDQTNLPNKVSMKFVTFFDTFTASVGYTYNPLVEKISNKIKFLYIDLEYHPKNHLEGYEEYQEVLLYAYDDGHMASLKRAIDENRERRIILENSW